MPVPVLTLVKLVLLAALYLFLFRAVKTVAADLYGSTKRRNAPPPRPAQANPEQPKRSSRKAPREIVVHPPNGRPQTVPLKSGRVTLGRADEADVLVDDVYVSDQHAEVAPDDDGGWAVRDLGSTNGTYLNGAKVTQLTPVSAGDQIRLGKTRVEVRR